MKIIENNSLKEVKFGTLNDGDAFMWLDDYYIKIESSAQTTTNAVHLSSGTTSSFLLEEFVTPLPDAKIVL